MKACLEFALNKIRNPQHWTKDYLARDANGEEANPRDPEAVCWCLYGAFLANPDRDAVEEFSEDFLQLFVDEFDTPIGPFNDTRTHSEIINWLEKKIAELS